MAQLSPTAKIALGVSAGYMLGRMKKLRLAITVGGMLAGQRIATNPQALLAQGSKLVESNPELKKLRGEITGRLFDAAHPMRDFHRLVAHVDAPRAEALGRPLHRQRGVARAGEPRPNFVGEMRERLEALRIRELGGDELIRGRLC